MVDPWALLLREGFWYLVGWYLDGDGFRFFRVDRIAGPVAEVGPVERARPPGFDPGAAFPTCPKQVGDDEVVTAELWVDVVLAAKVLAHHPAAEVVERPEDIGPALDRAFAAGVPYLVNVLTDPADQYPRTSNLG